jgi:hypothetical protein
MSDLMPTITDRSVPTHWDFEESVRQFVEVKEKALTSLSDLGREIWVAYKKTEGSRGGAAYGDAYKERFTFKAWCEAAGISRWAGMRAVRKYDPAIDANLRAQNAARKAALDAPPTPAPEHEESAPASLSGTPQRKDFHGEIWKTISLVIEAANNLQSLYGEAPVIGEAARDLRNVADLLMSLSPEDVGLDPLKKGA